MASSLSIGGLASGLDTNSIIDGLVGIERRRVLREEKKQSAYELKLSAYNDLKSKYATLSEKSTALNKSTAFNLFTSSSSDEDVVTITGNENAVPGSYEVTVQSLATTEKASSKSFSSFTTALAMTSTLMLGRSKAAIKGDPTTTETEITIDPTDTLKDIANKINRAEGTGMQATIMTLGAGEYRLVLNAVDEGSEGLKIRETSGTSVLSDNAAGLGILSTNQAIRSSGNFKLAAGGAAANASTWDALYAGVGGQFKTGDTFTLNGTTAGGTALTNVAYNLTETDSIGDFMTWLQGQYSVDDPSAEVTLNSSGEIVVKSTALGSPLTLQLDFTANGASNAQMSTSTSTTKNDYRYEVSQGRKAFYTLNGIAISSQSNTDENTVRGSVFNLKKADPTAPLKLSLSFDKGAIAGKVQEFIDGYNNILLFIAEKSKVELKDSKDETTGEKKQKVSNSGPFSGDSTVQRLKSQMRSLFTSQITELAGISSYNSLASLGITSSTGDGTLTLDSEKFNKALDDDFSGVQRLFGTTGYSSNSTYELGNYGKKTQTGTYTVDSDTDLFDDDKNSGSSNLVAANRAGDVLQSISGDSNGLSVRAPSGGGVHDFVFIRGVASQMKAFYDNISDSISGTFKQSTDSIQSSIDKSTDRAATLDEGVERFRQRLIAQFSALEQNMARLQSQSAAFQSQIGGLRR